MDKKNCGGGGKTLLGKLVRSSSTARKDSLYSVFKFRSSHINCPIPNWKKLIILWEKVASKGRKEKEIE